jgi:glycosyltransferase involved in cell wall biosynthesis
MFESISEIEQLLCGPATVGEIDGLAPRAPGAWSLQLPNLSALPEGREPWRKLRCCIATEDIAGPVRNGGIGTTYANLAELLVQLGHESTILYLKGAEVETGDLDHWVAHYAEKGVHFVPVPNYAEREGFRSHADRWLRSPYNMMRYLQEHPMDVVHVSEWRGCGYLSLAAKRQGVAFADTLFIVKTSSPWMWNRLYGAEPLERLDDLAKIYAERRSVELGDVVIGGSLHLLRWMSSQGYRLPAGRAFVQPNVVTFDNLRDLLGRRSVERGARMTFDEFVFFGRLEGRKGLFVFCQAVERLIRLGVPLPPTITFMGKEGRRLTSRPDLTSLEYIAEATRDWPTEVKVITDYQQHQALEYLLDGPRLAVMPSVIENSSMAIYEAAICGIPCVASNVGGNMELVAEADWPHIFCEPHPRSLGDKLIEALEIGGYVPRPSFDNAANLDTWRRFHDSLARGLREELLARAAPLRPVKPAVPAPTRAAPKAPVDHVAQPMSRPATGALGRFAGILRRPKTNSDEDAEFVRALRAQAEAREATSAALPPAAQAPARAAHTLSACVYVAGAPGALRETLFSLASQTVPHDVVLAIDAPRREHLHEAQALAESLDINCRIVEAFDMDAGAAFNRAAELAEGSLLLFLWEGFTLAPQALATLAQVAEQRPADVLTFMHRVRAFDGSGHGRWHLRAPLFNSVTDAFLQQDVMPTPLLVTRDAFWRLDGFTSDYRQLGHEAEFMAHAHLARLECDTVLEDLGCANGPTADWIAARGYDLPASRFRIARPLLAASPLATRDLMLLSKGLQGRGGAAPAVKSKAPRLDTVIEEPFTRMIQEILTENSRPPGSTRTRASRVLEE